MWLLATATLGQSLLFHRYIHDSSCHSNLFHIILYLTYLRPNIQYPEKALHGIVANVIVTM